MEHSNKEDELTTTSSNSVNKNLMTHEEKLNTIKKEVQTLYEFCTSEGFSETDMSVCLAPFAGNPPERVTRACKTNVRFLFGVTVVVGILAAVTYTDTGYNVFCIHGKIVIMQVPCHSVCNFGAYIRCDKHSAPIIRNYCTTPMKSFTLTGKRLNENRVEILPYWNWTYIYNEDCFLPNAFRLPDGNMTKDECKGCLELCSSIKNGTGSVDFVKNATYDDISENFLYADFPGVIEDSLRGWPKPNITLPYLHQIYTTDHRFENLTECPFNSSIPDHKSVHDFFKAYETHSLPENWYARWENCQIDAVKVLRLHYKRPYFLPPMAAVAKTNGVIVGKGRLKEAFKIESDDMGLPTGAIITVTPQLRTTEKEPSMAPVLSVLASVKEVY